jgi:fumarate hydratase class II
VTTGRPSEEGSPGAGPAFANVTRAEARANQAELAALSFEGMKGIRYVLRNFTALSVKEHLRSQVEQSGSGAELTPNEVELVRFAADRSDQLNELADRSPRGRSD